MADYKVVPHSIEAEQAVLGCVLFDNLAQTDIFPEINEDDFYSEAHQQIYKAMIEVYKRNVPVDFITLSDQLEHMKILDKVGGIEYITFLTNVVPSSANFKYYCDIVKGQSMRRKLIKAGQDIIEESFKSEDKDHALMFAEQVVYDISEKEERSSLEAVGKPGGAVKQVIDKFSAIAKDPTSIKGIATGFTEFDIITNGLQNSDLILLAARPGVGKTSFSMNILTYAATVLGKKCAVFSLEMGKAQLMQRAICSLARVSMAKALNGSMSAEEWQRVWSATKKLEASGLYIDDSSMTSPTDLLSKCRRLKMKEGLDIVMVDYIQLMSTGKKSVESRQVEVGEISRTLKIAAKELNVPIIALSQLSRQAEMRTDHHPMLSDLRDSGSIEQDADIVLFLYNPDKYADVTNEEPGIVELMVAKHRNGRTGTVKLRWHGEIVTFTNLDDRIKPERRAVQPGEVTEKPVSAEEADVFDD